MAVRGLSSSVTTSLTCAAQASSLLTQASPHSNRNNHPARQTSSGPLNRSRPHKEQNSLRRRRKVEHPAQMTRPRPARQHRIPSPPRTDLIPSAGRRAGTTWIGTRVFGDLLAQEIVRVAPLPMTPSPSGGGVVFFRFLAPSPAHAGPYKPLRSSAFHLRGRRPAVPHPFTRPRSIPCPSPRPCPA